MSAADCVIVDTVIHPAVLLAYNEVRAGYTDGKSASLADYNWSENGFSAYVHIEIISAVPQHGGLVRALICVDSRLIVCRLFLLRLRLLWSD